jgi:hypothetical protein
LGSRLSAAALDVVRGWPGAIRSRSVGLIRYLDLRMDGLIAGWIALTVLAGAAKVLMAPVRPAGFGEAMLLMLPYLLIALAPIAGYRLTAGSFPRGLLSAQPSIRLARFGNWKRLDVVEVRANPSFGPVGFMASLIIGILLNVPVRTIEYLTAVPAVSGSAPAWAQTYFLAMTADVIVMNFFYMVCFVMALRSIPLFPRMLLFAWAADIAMQLIIAGQLAAAPNLPHSVVQPLVTLLRGNIDKVLISAFVWLPYILLSERVNVTYRLRTAATT